MFDASYRLLNHRQLTPNAQRVVDAVPKLAYEWIRYWMLHLTTKLEVSKSLAILADTSLSQDERDSLLIHKYCWSNKTELFVGDKHRVVRDHIIPTDDTFGGHTVELIFDIDGNPTTPIITKRVKARTKKLNLGRTSCGMELSTLNLVYMIQHSINEYSSLYLLPRVWRQAIDWEIPQCPSLLTSGINTSRAKGIRTYSIGLYGNVTIQYEGVRN
jgi:hypothetical protein